MPTSVFTRIVTFVDKYGWRWPFFLFGNLFVLLSKYANALRLFKYRLFCLSRIGGNVEIETDVYITPRGRISIGDNAKISTRSIIEIGPQHGFVEIGNNVFIAHDCHVLACNRLVIGDMVKIAEFVSIRDTQHSFERSDIPIFKQGHVYGQITIEEGAWIGRGCLILGRVEGIVIGENSIIAANSTVHFSVPRNEIWGGSPARFIRKR